MVATSRTMVMRSLFGLAVAVLAAALLVGCSSGVSSSAPSNASVSSGSSTSASSTEATASSGSGASGIFSSDSASTGSSASASSASASATSDDFDRMVVGTWRIYSLEYGGYSKTKIGNDEMTLLRELGLFESVTLFADGNYQINHGRTDIYNDTWEESGYNEIVLHKALDKDQDTGEYKDATATISSGRMIIEYDSPKYKHVKLVYSKQ